MWETIIAFGLLVAGTSLILYLAFRPRQCPRCKRRGVTIDCSWGGLTLLSCRHCGARFDCDEGSEGSPDDWRISR